MPWNMSNPLYRWKAAHGKLNKSVKHRRPRGKTMARRAYRRLRRYRPRRSWFKRYRAKAKIPLEVAIGAIAIPWTPAASGFATPADCLASGDTIGLMDSLKVGFLGFEPGRETIQFNLWKALNPLDFEHARYTKMLIYAGLMSKIRKRLVHVPFEKVPLVGRYIS